MIACPFKDLFPYNNDAIHEKWNTKWNVKSDKLKKIKPATRSWREKNRCRKDKTVITNSELAIHY